MKLNTFAASVLMAAMATAAPLSLEKRTSYTGGATASDIENGLCAPVTFLFARGSTETGTMGNSVGPAFANALIKAYGASNVAVQGVDDYSASIESNASLGSDGGPQMAKLGKQAISQCPSTKLVLSGYSQGATVTHYAVGNQGGLPASNVAAVVLYGDPLQSQAVGNVPSSKVKRFCASGDGVCETGTFAISAAHLSYTTDGDINTGVQYVQSTIGATGSGSSTSSGSGTAASAAPAASAAAGSSSGLGGLLGGSTGTGSTSASGGLGSLGSLLGGGGTSSSSLGGLGSLGGASSGGSGLGSLGSLSGGSTGSSGLGSLGSLGSGTTGGFPSASTGLSGLGGLGESSGSSGLGGLGSLGSGSTGSSGLGSLGSLGSGSTGSSGLGSLGGL